MDRYASSACSSSGENVARDGHDPEEKASNREAKGSEGEGASEDAGAGSDSAEASEGDPVDAPEDFDTCALLH